MSLLRSPRRRLTRGVHAAAGRFYDVLLERRAAIRTPARAVLRATGLEDRALSRPGARRILLDETDPRFAAVLDAPPRRVSTTSDVELHMLVCERDFLRSMWALESFFRHSGIDARLVLHDDGTLSARSRAVYGSRFPGCELAQPRRDEVIERLRGFPACQDFRARHFISGKLLDVLLFARAPYVVVMDSDILWFRPSPPIQGAIRTGTPFYVNGGGEAYARNRGFLESKGLRPARNLNSGIVGYRHADFEDYPFLETCLERMVHVPREELAGSLGYRHRERGRPFDPDDPVGSIVWWVMEQTLYALLFGRRTDAVLLEANAAGGAVSHPFGTRAIQPTTALQHFISDRRWNGFFPVGVDHLLASGFSGVREPSAPSASSSPSKITSQS